MKTLEFKSMSPLFELARDGKKRFDIRLYDGEDERFKQLAEWDPADEWAIRLVNSATGESHTRELLVVDDLTDPLGDKLEPRWLIFWFGDEI